MPSRENISKALRRIRRKNLPPNPKALSELDELPARFQRTLADENFLIFDSRSLEQMNGRVIVFGTKRNLVLLNKSAVWFLDGTFKVITFCVNKFSASF